MDDYSLLSKWPRLKTQLMASHSANMVKWMSYYIALLVAYGLGQVIPWYWVPDLCPFTLPCWHHSIQAWLHRLFTDDQVEIYTSTVGIVEPSTEDQDVSTTNGPVKATSDHPVVTTDDTITPMSHTPVVPGNIATHSHLSAFQNGTTTTPTGNLWLHWMYSLASEQ